MGLRLRFYVVCGILFLGLSNFGHSYPLPPKEIEKILTEKSLSDKPQIRANLYEILDTQPRIHGGLYYDQVRQRLRVLDPDTSTLKVLNKSLFAGARTQINRAEIFKKPSLENLKTWIYADSVYEKPLILNHGVGRFKILRDEILYVPESLDQVFWRLLSDFRIVGARRTQQRGVGLIAWSLWPAGFWYLPPRATQVYRYRHSTAGEFLAVMDCPGGERFVVVENYRNSFFRFIFLNESLEAIGYSLFDAPQNENQDHMLSGVTHLGDCKNFIVIGSWGLGRIRYDDRP